MSINHRNFTHSDAHWASAHVLSKEIRVGDFVLWKLLFLLLFLRTFNEDRNEDVRFSFWVVDPLKFGSGTQGNYGERLAQNEVKPMDLIRIISGHHGGLRIKFIEGFLWMLNQFWKLQKRYETSRVLMEFNRVILQISYVHE